MTSVVENVRGNYALGDEVEVGVNVLCRSVYMPNDHSGKVDVSFIDADESPNKFLQGSFTLKLSSDVVWAVGKQYRLNLSITRSQTSAEQA
jgi:hypothetical protein